MFFHKIALRYISGSIALIGILSGSRSWPSSVSAETWAPQNFNFKVENKDFKPWNAASHERRF